VLNNNHYFTLGIESLPTATITGGTTSLCNDGSSTNIPVTLTGVAPWTIKYKINGANETTISKELREAYQHWQGREITVTTDPPQTIHGDGDMWGETPVSVKVLPHAVSVLVPAAGFSGAFAGVCGILLGNIVRLQATVLTFLVIPAFAAAIIGRLSSLPTTVAGGLAVGILEALAVVVPGFSPFRTATPFLIALLAIVLWRDASRSA
jgi:hypothetical protein